jgi:hypothetical protein
MNAVKDQNTRRVKRVRISVRDLIAFLYMQGRLPDYVTISKVKLPPGSTIVHLSPMQPPFMLGFEVLIHNEAFEEVPTSEEPPLLFGGAFAPVEQWMYGLATEEEMAARRATPREEGQPEPIIAQGVKVEEPTKCSATLLGLKCELPDRHGGPHQYQGGRRPAGTVLVERKTMLCDCDCATACPLGKAGMQHRCGVRELQGAGIKIRYVD